MYIFVTLFKELSPLFDKVLKILESSEGNYEEIHGSLCPAVSTRVVKPYIQVINIKNEKTPSYSPKQYYFNQGRRR